jgi:hypothetical protein
MAPVMEEEEERRCSVAHLCMGTALKLVPKNDHAALGFRFSHLYIIYILCLSLDH